KPGTTYQYAVTALDNARRSNESPRSNVVSVRVEEALHFVLPDLLGHLTTTEQGERSVCPEHHLGRLGVGVVVDGRHARAVGSGPTDHHQVPDLRARHPARREGLGIAGRGGEDVA